MAHVRRFLVLPALLLALTGCLSRGEPADSEYLRHYRDLAPGTRFEKVYADPNISLAGLKKVWVRPVQITIPARKPWFDSEDHSPGELAAFLFNVREAFDAELSTGFRVLPDGSFADEQTIVVSAQITDLSVVPLPGKPMPWYDRLFPSRVYVGIEMSVYRCGAREPAFEIKAWRTGAQPIRRAMEPGLGDYGRLLTIFYFWGDRLRQFLVEATRKPPETRQNGRMRLF